MALRVAAKRSVPALGQAARAQRSGPALRRAARGQCSGPALRQAAGLGASARGQCSGRPPGSRPTGPARVAAQVVLTSARLPSDSPLRRPRRAREGLGGRSPGFEWPAVAVRALPGRPGSTLVLSGQAQGGPGDGPVAPEPLSGGQDAPSGATPEHYLRLSGPGVSVGRAARPLGPPPPHPGSYNRVIAARRTDPRQPDPAAGTRNRPRPIATARPRPSVTRPTSSVA